MVGGLVGTTAFAGSAQLVAIVVADGHEGRAPVVARPSMRRLDGGPRGDSGFGDGKCEQHDLALHVDDAGLAARIAEWKVDEHEPWDSGLLDDVAGTADDDGRNAGRFEMAGDQTHGLVTHRSKWDEQGNVDPVVAAPLRDLLGVQPCPALAVLGRHTEEPVVQ